MEGEVAITFCFHIRFTHCTALQMKNSTRSIPAINPVTMENTGNKSTQPQGSRITLLQIDTLLCQRKELEHKASP